VLCATNMMIHGIEVPSNIINDNTLARPLRDYGKKDQVDVIITNPPFGWVEEDGIENNFPAQFRPRETVDLFLVLVMDLLKEVGRAAIVLPDGTLFGEGIKTRIKKKMLEECNLHTIVRLPKSVFAPYTSIATNVLFLTKGEPTEEIWYYEHPLPENVKAYSKTKPMRVSEFDAEKHWWSKRNESEVAWKVSVKEIAENNYNLDIKNPNAPVLHHQDSGELFEEFSKASVLKSSLQDQLRQILEKSPAAEKKMNHLLSSLDIVTEAPDGVKTLRKAVLGLAVSGQLVEQRSSEGTGKQLIVKICDKRGISYTAGSTNSVPLPMTWATAKLGELVHIEMGQSPDSDSYNQRGEGLPFYQGKTDFGLLTPSPRFWCSQPRKIAQPGDVLLSVRAPVGPTNFVTEASCIGRGLAALRPLGGMRTEFILWWMRAYEPEVAMMGTGTTFVAVSKKSLDPFRVAVPPLAEQERILTRITELMDI